MICLDGQCKIVDVRLHWDRLGAYTKYKLAKGVELEKKDGLPFEEEDYEKLQTILLDKTSIFQDFELGEIVDVKKDDGDIDGISGATILTDESASVKGATWTCYTLWHWANGTIQDTIQHITAKTTSKEVLLTFLTDKDKRFKPFALIQFRQQKIYEQSVIQSIIEHANHFEPATTKLMLQYLKGAPSTLFYAHLKQLFSQGNKQQQNLYLKALLDKNQHLNKAYLTQINHYIPQLSSYQNINLLITFLDNRQIVDSQINEQLMSLLDNENFIIARRVYWYLVEAELTSKQHRKVQKFGKKYKEKL